MIAITVYDPPMCCATGVCGVEIDPRLAQFASDLAWLKGQGVTVHRFNLAQEPDRFVENAAVRANLDHTGGDGLPMVMAGETIIASGHYPSRAELTRHAGIVQTSETAARNHPSAEMKPLASASSCCGGAAARGLP